MPPDAASKKSNSLRGRRPVTRHGVRERLQQMVLEGRWQPGTKLVQQQLARQFGVAQSVIREALLELQACGLVETIDNRGIFVSQLNAQRLIESFEVREVHEGLAAYLCCECINRTQLRDLFEMAEQICSLGNNGELEEMASLDRKFHNRLLHLSGNNMLIRLAENYRVLGKVIRVGRDPDAVRQEHLAILTAIEANHPREAEQLMREHIRAGRQAVQEQVKTGKFVPRWVL